MRAALVARLGAAPVARAIAALAMAGLLMTGGCRRQAPPPASQPAQATNTSAVSDSAVGDADSAKQAVAVEPARAQETRSRIGIAMSAAMELSGSTDRARSARMIAARRAMQGLNQASLRFADVLNHALAASRRAPLAYLKAGDQAVLAGRYERALVLLEYAQRLDAGSLDAAKARANVLTAMGRHGEAADAYGDLAQRAGDDLTAMFNHALACSRCGRLDQAQRTYLQLLAKQPRHVQARYNLAGLYQLQGQLEQARTQWEQVVAQAPQLGSASRCLGDVLLDLRQPGPALEAYVRAAHLEPQDPTAWMDVAEAAIAAGRPGQAAAVLQRASRLLADPTGGPQLSAPGEASPATTSIPADQAWAGASGGAPDAAPNVATDGASDPAPQPGGNLAAPYRRLGDLYLRLHRLTGRDEFVPPAVASWRMSLEHDSSQDELRELIATYQGVGDTVGPAEGAGAGPPVGAGTGSAVGIGVGSAIGASVGGTGPAANSGGVEHRPE